MPGINFRHVSFGYLPKKPVIKNVSFNIKPGDFLGISGTNGSGKTTLLYLLNGLIPQEIKGNLTGEILINDISTVKKPVSFFSKTIGLVFQNPDLALFNLSVQEEITFGNPQANVASVLKQVNLSGYENYDPQTLSFGQKQKVCLAGILARNPNYLILDEPTAMLDYKSSVDLYEILTKLNQQGKTIVVVEHDTDFLLKYAQHVLILDSGKIKSYGQTKTVLSQKSLLKILGIKMPHL